jgi:site-specific recombinase XerD
LPATISGYHAGRAAPSVDEIVAVMRKTDHTPYGHRLNALIIVLWRPGLRIQEALSLTETDLDKRRGSVLVRHGKNDKRREVGMDAWPSTARDSWLADRAGLPVGPLFCVINGSTCGRGWSPSAARIELRHVAREAGVRRQFAPHQLRHAHAVELLHGKGSRCR